MPFTLSATIDIFTFVFSFNLFCVIEPLATRTAETCRLILLDRRCPSSKLPADRLQAVLIKYTVCAWSSTGRPDKLGHRGLFTLTESEDVFQHYHQEVNFAFRCSTGKGDSLFSTRINKVALLSNSANKLRFVHIQRTRTESEFCFWLGHWYNSFRLQTTSVMDFKGRLKFFFVICVLL